MRVSVVGGHGKTGRAVGAALARRGHEAVPLGRADWPTLADWPALAEAMGGCHAAYLIAPNLHPDEPAYVGAALDAARAAGIERVVLHSVAAPYAPAMPHHLGKAAAEDVVRRGGLSWTILQPGAYLQNVDLTRTVRIAYRADAPFGFADLDDVAEAAAVVLTEPGHDGATYELASRRATVAELAAEAGVDVEVIGLEEWAATDGADLDPRVRDGLLAMFAYYDAHGLPVGTLPLRALLGR
ncbi:MAG: NAD(P)H-binding protein [Nocardioides sp.]